MFLFKVVYHNCHVVVFLIVRIFSHSKLDSPYDFVSLPLGKVGDWQIDLVESKLVEYVYFLNQKIIKICMYIVTGGSGQC